MTTAITYLSRFTHMGLRKLQRKKYISYWSHLNRIRINWYLWEDRTLLSPPNYCAGISIFFLAFTRDFHLIKQIFIYVNSEPINYDFFLFIDLKKFSLYFLINLKKRRSCVFLLFREIQAIYLSGSKLILKIQVSL